MCIGDHFAMMGGVLLLATLAQRAGRDAKKLRSLFQQVEGNLEAEPIPARTFDPQFSSGVRPTLCCIDRISGLDMKVLHTSPVRPFSIITTCGA